MRSITYIFSFPSWGTIISLYQCITLSLCLGCVLCACTSTVCVCPNRALIHSFQLHFLFQAWWWAILPLRLKGAEWPPTSTCPPCALLSIDFTCSICHHLIPRMRSKRRLQRPQQLLQQLQQLHLCSSTRHRTTPWTWLWPTAVSRKIKTPVSLISDLRPKSTRRLWVYDWQDATIHLYPQVLAAEAAAATGSLDGSDVYRCLEPLQIQRGKEFLFYKSSELTLLQRTIWVSFERQNIHASIF